MKRKTKLSLFIVGTLVLVGSFSACGFRGDAEQRSQWIQEKVTKKLELNNVQQAQLENVSAEMMAARNDMKQRFGDDREQLLALLEQATLDQSMILTLIESRTQALNERAPVIVAAVGEFYDGLTAEQQAEVREFIQEHRGRHGYGDQRHRD